MVNIKGKTELIGDVITLLQSPAKNVISALSQVAHCSTMPTKNISSEKEKPDYNYFSQ